MIRADDIGRVTVTLKDGRNVYAEPKTPPLRIRLVDALQILLGNAIAVKFHPKGLKAWCAPFITNSEEYDK